MKMHDPFLVTAVNAVSVLKNCTAKLYYDGGSEINGRWVEGRSLIDDVPACIQRAKASDIKRFDRGEERLEGWSTLHLMSEPSIKPEYVEVNGEEYKVFDVDFRPSRLFFKLIMARLL